MSQQINAVTIAVNDIKLMRKFYHDILGWAVLAENPEVVMLKLNNAVLTLCSIPVFAEYTGTYPDDGSKKGFYLTTNLESPKRVDDYFKKLANQQVMIIKKPEKTFWGGYGGFFADAEGNKWEICFNPIAGTKV